MGQGTLSRAEMILIDPRQVNWILAAIAYYRAKVEIYKLMVEEWENELAEIERTKTSAHLVPNS